ncbi:MAG: indolepyruvate oxidoreductase subunit beta [Peptostreptococcaceae bacterium]
MKNIILAGVGGQGLVLATKIICEVGFRAGFEIKSNDVIGLSQRGGKVYGSVRIGDKVHSPNIKKGDADILLGLEPLEAYRWSNYLKSDGLVILNTYKTYPTPVLMEVSEYPKDINDYLSNNFNLIQIDAIDEGCKLGNTKVSNTFLLGMLAKNLEDMINKNIWLEVIKELVPTKSIDDNISAFEIGYNY